MFAAFMRFLSSTCGAVQKKTVGAAAGITTALALAAAMFIGPWEGEELRAYRDIVGVPTICMGETRGVQIGDIATHAECQSMLARAVTQFAVAIQPCLPTVLPDKTRVAFISAAYNIGASAFCGSSMARYARAGDLRSACTSLLLWNKAGGKVVAGLTRRREAERALCLEGIP